MMDRLGSAGAQRRSVTQVSFGIILALLTLSALLGRSSSQAAGSATPTPRAYLPLIASPQRCPTISNTSYSRGLALQYDLDDPVRPAAQHADKSIDLRGYVPNNDASVRHDLINYGRDDPTQPPQFATLFSPARVPHITTVFQVYNWNWAPSPDPGWRGTPQTIYPATALALTATPGEVLRVPASGYDIGGGMEVLVLYADEETVALRYTREDSSGSPGYTVFIDNICTDPNLLALYERLDRPDGPRYVFVPPRNRPYGYDLPVLPAGRRIGVVGIGHPVIAVSDTGVFQDPRSCNGWWQIRPGYGRDCTRD